MIKFLLSIFVLIFMPLRLLFFFSVMLNIGLVFAISSFIVKDNYYESFEHSNSVMQRAEKILEKSCEYNIKCSIKVYAKDGEKLVETFEKAINEKPNENKKGIFNSIKAPIQKLISESDLKKFLKEEEVRGEACITPQESSITCATHQVVVIFKAENCASCIQNFKKEFRVLEKIYYKSFLIKISHKTYDFFLKVFGFKKEDTNVIKNKIKNIISENLENL